MFKFNLATVFSVAALVLSGGLGCIYFYYDIVGIAPELRVWFVTDEFPAFFLNVVVYFLGVILTCFHVAGLVKDYELSYFRIICCCFCCVILLFIYFAIQVGYITQFQFVILFYLFALYFTECEKQKSTESVSGFESNQ